jgi:hypothetical protein
MGEDFICSVTSLYEPFAVSPHYMSHFNKGIMHKVLEQYVYFTMCNLTPNVIGAPGDGPIAETWRRETVSVCNVGSVKLVSVMLGLAS